MHMLMRKEEPEIYTMQQALLDAGASQQYAAPFSGVALPYRLRQDQLIGLKKMIKMKRFGLFPEARTGKTIIFAIACIYFAHHGVKSIILSPPVLFLQLEEQFASITGKEAKVATLNGLPKTRAERIAQWDLNPADTPHILIMTKEIFKLEILKLLRLGYTNLVYDEAHMGLQSEKSQTYAAVQYFCSKAANARFTPSTGTPIPNEIINAYPIISLVNPSAYLSRAQFDRKHVIYAQQRFGRRTVVVNVGYKDISRVHSALYANAHRVTKAEVLGLGAPHIQVLPVRLSKSHQGLYRRLMTTRVLEHRGQTINAVQAQALRQIALQMITTPHDFGAVKDNAVLDLVQELLQDVGAATKEKVVLFANYNRSVETLRDTLSAYDPAVVYGPGRNNAQEAERFKKDPKCRVLIANPVAGGVGLTLGGVSSTAIFVEPVSTPGQFDQACSRIMLAGQTEPVSVYIFKVMGTISPRAIELMLIKGDEIKQVNKDPTTLLDELLGGEK